MRKGIVAVLILWLLLPMGSAFALGDKPPPEPTWNYQGIWWGSPAGSESGWAIGITHQGKSIVATWFTYDTDGSPMWLVMPAVSRQTYGYYDDVYSGPLYRATGPAFNVERWDPARVSMTPVGTASFTFTGNGSGTFTYLVNGSRGSKRIEKQVFSARLPSCSVGGVAGSAPNYTDLWGLESGWGIHIAHQGQVIFAAWFTYRADGKGDWVVMPNGVRINDRSYSGALYRTRGPAFGASPWNPSLVTAAPVGRATFTFVQQYVDEEASASYHDEARFDFTLDGVSGSKPVSRETFAAPVTVCNGD